MADDELTAALDEIRQRDKAVAMGHVRDPEDVPRLLAAVEKVLNRHSEYRIYDECDHRHAYDSDDERDRDGVIDCGDFVTCKDGYAYSVCKECCAAAGAGHTEECASGHLDGANCWPCPTVRAISRALLSKETERS